MTAESTRHRFGPRDIAKDVTRCVDVTSALLGQRRLGAPSDAPSDAPSEAPSESLPDALPDALAGFPQGNQSVFKRGWR